MLITVVIPTFNSMSENKRIDRLLNSIFNQTYKSFEVIVVDNFSKDKTKEVCNKYSITFIQERSTISKAWNTGLEHAKGKYILFIDSDMELPPSFLEDCVRVIKSKSVDCIKMEFTYVESKKASFINIVKARNLELKLGASPCNIYFYSTDIVKNTKYPESENPVVGEEYIFRNCILKKNPEVGAVRTKVFHYYDPSITWLARRCFKYGKWFRETRKHLSAKEAVEFFSYNSILKKDFVRSFHNVFRNEPDKVPSFALYICIKYISFGLGRISSFLHL